MADGETPQQADARAVLLEQVWANPEARPYLEEALAKTYPKAEIPGRQARVVGAEVLKKADQKLAEADKKIADWRAERDLEKAHAALEKDGHTPEDIQAIEKLMVDEGVGSHQNAALIYKSRRVVATPRSVGLSMAVPGKGNELKGYFNGILADREQWGAEKRDQILNDFANGRGDKWLDESYWPAHPVGDTPPADTKK
jgi:hypothetical protein